MVLFSSLQSDLFQFGRVPTTVCFEALMLCPQRLVSTLQLRHKLLQLILDPFGEFVQLRPLQRLEQDGRRHLLLLYRLNITVNGQKTLVMERYLVAKPVENGQGKRQAMLIQKEDIRPKLSK